MTIEELKQEISNITNRPISSMVEHQIDKFSREGITYDEIYKSFYYHYVVKNNDLNAIDRYGIGIIPLIKKEAIIYFNKIETQKNIKVNAAKTVMDKGVEERTYSPVRRIFDKGGIDIGDL